MDYNALDELVSFVCDVVGDIFHIDVMGYHGVWRDI
jgi:hypothetical protein